MYVIRFEGEKPTWYTEQCGVNLHTDNVELAELIDENVDIFDELKALAKACDLPPSMLRIQTVEDAKQEHATFHAPPPVRIHCDGRSVELTQAEFIEMLETTMSCPGFYKVNATFDFIEC